MIDVSLITNNPTILTVLLFGLFYGVIAQFGEKKATREKVEARLEDLTPLDAKKETVLRQMSMEGTFTQRIVLPLANKLFQQCKSILPLSEDAWAVKKLIHAGHTQSKHVQVFYGVQLLAILVGAIALPAYGLLVLRLPFGFPILLLGLTGAFVGLYIPILVLSTKARRRQDNIQKSLPDFLELLVICVESGLGLDKDYPVPKTQPTKSAAARRVASLFR